MESHRIAPAHAHPRFLTFRSTVYELRIFGLRRLLHGRRRLQARIGLLKGRNNYQFSDAALESDLAQLALACALSSVCLPRTSAAFESGAVANLECTLPGQEVPSDKQVTDANSSADEGLNPSPKATTVSSSARTCGPLWVGQDFRSDSLPSQG
ncbi:MAG: hypothetical protein QOH48_1428 [Actinomycetota bacterium]|nr:hypothetical protein [Actinomycetota bacterium]